MSSELRLWNQEVLLHKEQLRHLSTAGQEVDLLGVLGCDPETSQLPEERSEFAWNVGKTGIKIGDGICRGEKNVRSVTLAGFFSHGCIAVH